MDKSGDEREKAMEAARVEVVIEETSTAGGKLKTAVRVEVEIEMPEQNESLPHILEETTVKGKRFYNGSRSITDGLETDNWPSVAFSPSDYFSAAFRNISIVLRRAF
jgi:hypothetical protein